MKKYYLMLLFLLSLSLNKLTAQIIYTDVIPDSTVSASTSEQIRSYYIDLDNNGVYEFELRHFNPGPGNEDVELQRNFDNIEQVIINTDGHAKVLSKSDLINSGSITWGYDGYGILNSPWYGVGDKYFGFRFKISGHWYYGWARVNMPSDHMSFTIKDYAYNSVPDEPILAGNTTTSGIFYPALKKNHTVSIWPNPFYYSATILLNTPVGNGIMHIYNQQGQKVRSLSLISGSKINICRDELKAGIYFYEFISDNEIIDYGKIMVLD